MSRLNLKEQGACGAPYELCTPFPTLVDHSPPGCRARPSASLASDGRLRVASVGRTAYRSSVCDSTMTYKKPSAQRRRLWLAGEPGRIERSQRLSLARCQAQPALTGRAVMPHALNASRPLALPMSSAQAPRSRRSTLISHPTLLGERWMPSPGWEHLQGHCLAETLSFVDPALTTGRHHHCGRPRQAARATYRLRAHALLRRHGPCARWILGVGKGLISAGEKTAKKAQNRAE